MNITRAREIMSSKKMYKLITIVFVAAVLVFGYICLAQSSGQQSELNVSPETVVAGSASNKTLNFNLKLKSQLPILSASLETVDTTAPVLKVSLSKQSDGSFSGSAQVPADWMTKPRTITFVLYINGIKTTTIARFAVTDIAVILPSDPGEAGKATLAGIDSDKDGVRDDLQREIVFMYPDKDEARRLLRAMTKNIQDMIITEGDHEHFKDLMISAFAFGNCYSYKVFSLGQYDPANERLLWKIAENTPERDKTMEANQYKATPFGSLAGGSADGCENLKGQY